MICFFGLGLSGCGTAQTSNEEKIEQANIEKTGTIQAKSDEGFLLNTGDGIVTIVSKKIDLESYMKQKVTVKGMYSGSILYVDQLE